MPRIHFDSEEERLQYNRDRAKKYREKYPDKEKERQKKWRDANPEKVQAYYLNKNKENLSRASKKWRKNNPEKVHSMTTDWRSRNKEKLSVINKRWRDNNRDSHLDKRRNQQKEKRNVDSLYKLGQNIRIAISSSFRRGKKGFKKPLKTEIILGCDISFLIEYLTTKCGKELTPQDFHRYGYHIDHIVPISTAKTEEDVIKLCHYTNLQPLWWEDNLSKSDKII